MEARPIAECISKLLLNKKAIIFDMDGVLVDSSPIHEKSFKEALREIESLFDYKEYAGMGTEQALRKFLSDDRVIHHLKGKKREKALSYMKSAKLYPYAKKLLMFLKNKGFKIALASSASPAGINEALNKDNLRDYFDIVLSGEDIKESKPSPEIYLKALEKLGVKAEEALVIEDAPNGIDAAKKAKIETIGVLHSYSEGELAAADFISPDMHAIYTSFNSVISSCKSVDGDANLNKVITIIPAAGKGTRLKFDKPKILFPLKGIAILDRLYEKVKPISSKIIVVTNPEFAPVIKQHISDKGLDISVQIVENSLGTADSVLSAESSAGGEENVLIIWGDQVGIKADSIKRIVAMHQTNGSDFSLPVILVRNPYIHLERDENGRIIKVLRRRFEQGMPICGENDSGVFVAKRDLLFSKLNEMKKDYLGAGQNSEFDFLEIIPALSCQGSILITGHCVSEQECVGLNDEEEAKFHESLL